MEKRKDCDIWYSIEGHDIYRISKTGVIQNCKTSKDVPVFSDRNGYKSVVLRRNAKRHAITIHRLLALTFIPNPENKAFVNHKNGVKGDNRIVNLEWATPKENVDHAIKTGLRGGIKGERNIGCKLTVDQVIAIFQAPNNISELARRFNVSKSAISKIKNGQAWSSVTGLPLRLRKIGGLTGVTL